MSLSLYAFHHMTLQEVKQNIEQIEPEYLTNKYLIAVSGGVDSMVLLHLCHELKMNIEVAHVNYHLRGEDSNLDQRLVEEFCSTRALPLHIYNVSENDQKPQNSIQNWARDLRYEFFRTLMHERQLDKILTAHHANDNLETFIINLSKGAGLKGLSGIPKKNEKLLRPLLSYSKDELYEFAERYKIPFREDSSNKKDDYLRNRIRHHISPELLKTNENFLKNFTKSLQILAEAQDLLNESIEEKRRLISYTRGNDIVLDKLKIRLFSSFLKYEIFSPYGFENLNEIEKFFTAETGAQFFSESYRLVVNRDELILTLKNNTSEEDIIKELQPQQPDKLNLYPYLKDETFQLHWKLNSEKIKFPLHLRHKKEGDIFYPKGMKGKKKVSKFFKDEKLSILAKEKTWLLCDANDNILGIIPLRQDERFAAKDSTKNHFLIINQKDDEV